MHSRKHDAGEIVAAVQAFDSGTPAHAICIRLGIGLSTLYEWRRLYRGVPPAAVVHLEQLKRENSELKRQLERYTLDHQVLQAALRHQGLDVAARCSLVTLLLKKFRISVARACKLVGISRSLFLSRSYPDHLHRDK
ncbi:transposase [Burkholderia stagnalis]|uniref:transposase n=1 Tax=Burkholderia stagnalis TaxID=1503054 RepID=UPI00162AD616|nr:transposase [Burkholderia stagnalis]